MCLNIITDPDHNAMPNISDITSSIGISRVFSKLDLLKGYFQVSVNPEDVPNLVALTNYRYIIIRPHIEKTSVILCIHNVLV